MLNNPLTGQRTPRSRLLAITLVILGAVVLSTATVLGLHWAAAKPNPTTAGQQARGLGFSKLDIPAPNVLLPSLRAGGTVSLTKLAGKPIVLNFWSTTCVVCTKETPALVSVARALRGKVTFVGIDSVDRRTPAMAFVSRYHVPYSIAFDSRGIMATHYGVIALPVTFFLSPSGKTIMGENIGALTTRSLRAILRDLYGPA